MGAKPKSVNPEARPIPTNDQAEKVPFGLRVAIENASIFNAVFDHRPEFCDDKHHFNVKQFNGVQIHSSPVGDDDRTFKHG
jgi:hypothetical protein